MLRVDTNDGCYGKCKLSDINFNNYYCLVISDYNKSFLSENDIKFIAKSHKLIFIDTKKKIGDWCKDITFIKINHNEFLKAGKLKKNIKDKLIITVGSEGCIHKNVTYSVPKVEIRDTSGAGDSFLAGLVIKYLETKNIDEAIVFANECATRVVQKKGVSVI